MLKIVSGLVHRAAPRNVFEVQSINYSSRIRTVLGPLFTVRTAADILGRIVQILDLVCSQQLFIVSLKNWPCHLDRSSFVRIGIRLFL